MSKSRGLSETMIAMEYDRRKRDMIERIRKNTTSCYKCSRANPETVIKDQSIFRQYEDDSIKIVYDLKFNCNILKDFHNNANSAQYCADGNKSRIQRCSNCIYGKEGITSEYYSYKINCVKIKEKHILYKCTLDENDGNYYRSYFSCDKYVAKE